MSTRKELKYSGIEKDQIKNRLLQARETKVDAAFLFRRGSINSCVNRLFYEAYYATIALFLHYNIEVKSHKSVKQRPVKDFVLKDHI